MVSKKDLLGTLKVFDVLSIVYVFMYWLKVPMEAPGWLHVVCSLYAILWAFMLIYKAAQVE